MKPLFGWRNQVNPESCERLLSETGACYSTTIYCFLLYSSWQCQYSHFWSSLSVVAMQFQVHGNGKSCLFTFASVLKKRNAQFPQTESTTRFPNIISRLCIRLPCIRCIGYLHCMSLSFEWRQIHLKQWSNFFMKAIIHGCGVYGNVCRTF